jgi:hypothetical protein
MHSAGSLPDGKAASTSLSKLRIIITPLSAVSTRHGLDTAAVVRILFPEI